MIELAETYVRECGLMVQNGPFRGMRYVSDAAGSVLVPKLVGSYESELHAVMCGLRKIRPSVVVDIGCAEGFYAVGIARMLENVRVEAFDTDPIARRLCRQLAEINGVAGRVRVSGFCDHSSLQDVLKPGCVVIIDCEGYEWELLRPERVPLLRESYIVAELHEIDGIDPLREIQHRFGMSHGINPIRTQPKNPDDYPVLSFLSSDQKQLAVSEMRSGDQWWVYLTPRLAGSRGRHNELSEQESCR